MDRTAHDAPIADIDEARHAKQMSRQNLAVRRIRIAMLVGFGGGVVVEAAAIFAVIMSAGAGHGSYVAARILFPFSMLLTLAEGSVGPIAMSIGFLQFPLYGALLGRITVSKTTSWLFLLAVAHALAALSCFSGLLSDFS